MSRLYVIFGFHVFGFWLDFFGRYQKRKYTLVEIPVVLGPFDHFGCSSNRSRTIQSLENFPAELLGNIPGVKIRESVLPHNSEFEITDVCGVVKNFSMELTDESWVSHLGSVGSTCILLLADLKIQALTVGYRVFKCA